MAAATPSFFLFAPSSASSTGSARDDRSENSDLRCEDSSISGSSNNGASDELQGAWTKVSSKRSKKKSNGLRVGRKHSSSGDDADQHHSNKGSTRASGGRKSLGGSSNTSSRRSSGGSTNSFSNANSGKGKASGGRKSSADPLGNKRAGPRVSTCVSTSSTSRKQKAAAVALVSSFATATAAANCQAEYDNDTPGAKEMREIRWDQAKPQTLSAQGVASSTISTDERIRQLDDSKKQLRVWNMLFRSVNRTVDELYYMCEYDSALESCADAEEVLAHWLGEFRELKARITSQREKDNSKGLAWEVRKASPSPSLVCKDSAWVKKPNIIAAEDKAKQAQQEAQHQRRLQMHLQQQRMKQQQGRDEDAAGLVQLSDKRAPPPLDATAQRLKREQQNASQIVRQQSSDPPVPESEDSLEMVVEEEKTLSPNQESMECSSQPESGSGSSNNNDGDDHDHDYDYKEKEEEGEAENEEHGDLLSEDGLTPLKLTRAPVLWGDESVGLESDEVAVVSPKRAKLAKLTISTASKDLAVRSLHEKLSSPERRKPSPFETKRRQVEKQAMAKLNREKIDLERQVKLQREKSRQEQVALKEKTRQEEQEQALSEKLERAAAARHHRLLSVAKKAENESLKVNEVAFINEMTEQERTAQLNKRLLDGEKRRKEFIGTIQKRAEKQSEKAQALREREERKASQLREAMQKRHDDAEKRKQEALEEQRRQSESENMARSQKVIQNKQQLEEEKQKRLVLIKERKERADFERKKFLLDKVKNCSAPCSPSSSKNAGAAQEHLSDFGEELLDHGPTSTLAGASSVGSSACASGHPLTYSRAVGAPLNEYDASSAAAVLSAAHLEAQSAEAAATESVLQREERLKTLEKQLKKKARKSRTRLEEMAQAVQGRLPERVFRLAANVAKDPVPLLKSLRANAGSFYAADLVRGGHAMAIIDACVAFSTKSDFGKLISGLEVFRECLAAAVDQQNQALVNVALELVRYCLYSSLVLRAVEQGQGQNPDLVCAVMGLLEAMTLVIKTNCAQGQNPQGFAAGSAFMQAAESSNLFHIVSQLVAAFIGLENYSYKGGKVAKDKRRAKLAAAARSGLRTLNLLALMDLKLVQNAMGSPELSFELQQLLRYVMETCSSSGKMPLPPDQGMGSNLAAPHICDGRRGVLC